MHAGLAKPRIARFYRQEKSVVGHTTEAFPVEHGMIPTRQTVHDLPREKCSERGKKHCELEHDREKRWNREKVGRFSVHIDGVQNRRRAKLDYRSGEKSGNSAKQHPS